ncbi:MAG TPA: valine--tRNA ligase [Petrotogaceae bacterium]|nr:valine--tRNA ligase [Petrotogaceae bacterium]
MDIGKRYTPHELEKKWYARWKDEGAFQPSKDKNESFSIVIPPPNITGKLHMGHALNLTIQDILTRYKRMKGLSTLWLPGEDHAGIATQHVVEKSLIQTEGKRRSQYSREEFLKKVWEWADTYKGHIREQIMALGCSVDWTRERFTFDEGLSRAVRKVFVQLYNESLIYKGKYIVNWCPSCGTVLADDEVEHVDETGKLYYVKYPIKNSDRFITVATTRPETMLGDVALAVNPSDQRFKELVGKMVVLPLTEREIPVIADPYVDKEFGTGVVKITPAHDPNDYQVGIRQGLQMIQIMDNTAKMNELCGKYAGMDRYTARKEILKDLEEMGLLEKIEPHKHSVGHCYRCDTTVEPFLMDQWFVRMKPLAEKAKEVVKNQKTVFHPERWEKIYYNWLDEIRDWCISRQLWWGHRIPVWYCQDCGHINVSEEDVVSCAKCGSKNLKQDEDVLDTWFSSALWPFSTMGWPDRTQDLEKFYPTSVLVTAFDIIFFWVARMIMMGEKVMGQEPFKDVYITPLVRDKNGRKMSKSLGNGIDPLEVIEQYGTDPIRFTLAILAAQGRDIKLDPASFETYSKFSNKIWNATRFILLNLDGYEKIELQPKDLRIEDKWILTRMNQTIEKVSSAIDSFDFNIAAKELYDFFWYELCDWYIEAVKERLKSESPDRTSVQNTLVKVLDSSLKLMHPFMPFLTEELWHALPGIGEEQMIISALWPQYDEKFSFEDETSVFSKAMEVVRGIRNVKAEMNILQTKSVDIKYVSDHKETVIDQMKEQIMRLGFVSNIERSQAKPSRAATAYVGEGMEVYIPLGELIDFDAEKERLEKAKEKALKDVEKYQKKLQNKDFLERAEEEVIEETRTKLEDSQSQYDKVLKILQELT